MAAQTPGDLKGMTLGKRLKYFRNTSRLSIESLSSLSGIPAKTIKDIEDLKKVSDLYTTHALCKVLNMRLKDAEIALLMSYIETVENQNYT